MWLVDVLIGVLAAAITVPISVVIHEFGHFAFARLAKHYPNQIVLEGFGPRIRFNRGGVSVTFSILPWGGSVAYAGEQEGDVIPDGYLSWYDSPARRYITAFGGPLFQANVAFALFWVAFAFRRAEPFSAWGVFWSLLAVCHIAWAAHSLRPAVQSDGGHMLRAIIGAKPDAYLKAFNPLYRCIYMTIVVCLLIGAGLRIAEVPTV